MWKCEPLVDIISPHNLNMEVFMQNSNLGILSHIYKNTVHIKQNVCAFVFLISSCHFALYGIEFGQLYN